MARYVAFLRGINVGGHAVMTMADLQAMFRRAGGSNVKILIQSGNVLFDAPTKDAEAVVRAVAERLRSTWGESPTIMLRRVDQIEALVASAPFGVLDTSRAVKRYVVFLAKRPTLAPTLPLVSSIDALEVIGATEREVFVLSLPKKGGLFGFPNQFIERQFGVPATTRNWSTVIKLVADTPPTKPKAGVRAARRGPRRASE